MKVLQIGFGPLGIQIAKYILEKKTVHTVAVVDINDKFYGSCLNNFDPELPENIFVYNSVEEAMNSIEYKPDIAVITTVSSLGKLIPQIEEVAKYGISVISTCEELSYPWKIQPKLSKKLDDICKMYQIACLGTGVNPGFLMDYLPSVLSSVCKNLKSIKVERVQDATPRRLPFQKKIGAGLNLDSFMEKKENGSLRHVGLTESIHLLANSASIEIDEVVESLEPVVAKSAMDTGCLSIKKGNARGVKQIATGYINGDSVIKMEFKAAIGEKRSFDKITIDGTPSFVSEIEGGINGDIATCAITINAIKSVLNAPPGLHTMGDIAVPGFIN